MGISFVLYEGQAVAVGAEVEFFLDVVVVGHANEEVSFHIHEDVDLGTFLQRDFAADNHSFFRV